MCQHLIPKTLAVSLLIVASLTIGCDDRVAEVAREAADRQAQQNNEMAKLHVRYMVGGRAPDVRSERVCRFEFPERAGALLEFLDTLGGRWNISLFHYRNHGARSVDAASCFGSVRL